ncbi:MAG: group 1 truncated hemoglobin [Pseudomonadota bacterium]
MTRSVFAAAFLALMPLGSAVAGPTLYEQLGGEDGVAKIVDGMLDRAVKSPRIGHTFVEADMERLREKLELQFCELADGPCVYDGLSMADSHMGHDITPAHFNALVEDLQAAMDDADIPFRTQNRLLALLAPMKRDVVTAP